MECVNTEREKSLLSATPNCLLYSHPQHQMQLVWMDLKCRAFPHLDSLHKIWPVDPWSFCLYVGITNIIYDISCESNMFVWYVENIGS